MATILACPEETDLLALALGEPGLAEVGAHVDGCASCQKRLEQIQAELALLRANPPEMPLARSTVPSAASEATSDLEFACALVNDPGATASWEFDDMAGDRAARPPTDTVDDGTGSSSDEPPLPAALGKYLVIGRFPRTGQADVFRVVHPGLGKDLVLKLSLTPIRPDGRCEIIEEGKILAELDHPNLVRVYDSDFHDDRPYIVMEYVRGRTLEQVASGAGLKPRQAAAVLAKVATAAEYAHRKGIVHRDIKPKNILVDEAGEPRLIDFGMARLRHAWSDDRRESDGGTFAFMAPEQSRIESPEDRQKVGPRSDVFALGAVLYFLLTGRAPFHGQTWREAWDRARRCDYDAAALNDRKNPAGLRRICLKAMAADPADRYASAEELQKALQRFANAPKLRALAAGAASLVLLGGLAYALAPTRTDTKLSQTPSVAPHHALPDSLAGELIVRVWSKDEGGKRGLKVDEPGALPLLAGEMVRLEARLNPPAYPYLLWINGQGHVSVLYPRQDNKFGGSPVVEHAREKLDSPEALDGGHRMKGTGGLETALLLVRRTPLPSDVELAAAIGPLAPSPLRNELEVAVRGGDEGQPVATLNLALNRGIDEDQTARIDDPLLQLMERLRKESQFEVIKAVRFAYRGE
jgi:hypothetical protein